MNWLSGEGTPSKWVFWDIMTNEANFLSASKSIPYLNIDALTLVFDYSQEKVIKGLYGSMIDVFSSLGGLATITIGGLTSIYNILFYSRNIR